MAKDSSFDVVSQVDMQEMDNAVNQTKKEIAQRYDFRGSDASIELEEKCIKLAAEDEYKLNAIIDMLRARMAKRPASRTEGPASGAGRSRTLPVRRTAASPAGWGYSVLPPVW